MVSNNKKQSPGKALPVGEMKINLEDLLTLPYILGYRQHNLTTIDVQ